MSITNELRKIARNLNRIGSESIDPIDRKEFRRLYDRFEKFTEELYKEENAKGAYACLKEFNKIAQKMLYSEDFYTSQDTEIADNACSAISNWYKEQNKENCEEMLDAVDELRRLLA